MRLQDILRTAVKALSAHPVRTALTALGIAIGTATTAIVIILGHGVRDLLDDRLTSAGKNLILIRPGTFSEEGFSHKTPLTSDDAASLRSDPILRQLTLGFGEAQSMLQTVRVGGNQVHTTLEGVHPDVFKIREWALAAGRFLTRQDDSNIAPVCVIGHTVRQALFTNRPAENILGQKLTVHGNQFTIVGVLLPRGKDPLGRDHDDEVFISLSVVQARLTHSTHLTIIISTARDYDDMPAVVTRIRELLRRQHQLRPEEADDHDITSVQGMAEIGVFTISTLNLLTMILAGIALSVGGIGVMATLLVTVSEQTREIGLRTCVGALPRDIRNQLIMEGLIVTLGGGSIGIVAGILIALGLTTVLEWPFSVSMEYPLMGLAILLVIGITAGLYPAILAGRMNPVTALHAE